MRMKRKRSSESGERKEEDRLSDLPDEVLQHIMGFLPTKQAIQSCVLSKRWKNLWKGLTTLTFTSFNGIRKYNRYVSHALSNRDDSIPLHNMHVKVFNSTTPKVLNNALKYASQHHLQKLTLVMDFKFKKIPNSFIPIVINCKSLTFLNLHANFSRVPLTLPASLSLPSLKTLLLSNVIFTPRDDDNYIEPFSECTSLTTLVLEYSTHSHSTQTLCISNPSLSVLTMENIFYWDTFEPKIVLSVPKLTSITLGNIHFLMSYKFSCTCTCDLPLLNEVKINNNIHIESSIVLSWLRMFSNARTLTISSRTLNSLLLVRYIYFFLSLLLNLTF